MTDKEKLITDNMGYVVTLARQYSCELLDTDDLVSEGTIGIIKAVEKFDPNRVSLLLLLPHLIFVPPLKLLYVE